MTIVLGWLPFLSLPKRVWPSFISLLVSKKLEVSCLHVLDLIKSMLFCSEFSVFDLFFYALVDQFTLLDCGHVHGFDL
jgi:hypothetical protein